jgi:hypothetical protein
LHIGSFVPGFSLLQPLCETLASALAASATEDGATNAANDEGGAAVALLGAVAADCDAVAENASVSCDPQCRAAHRPRESAHSCSLPTVEDRSAGKKTQRSRSRRRRNTREEQTSKRPARRRRRVRLV